MYNTYTYILASVTGKCTCDSICICSMFPLLLHAYSIPCNTYSATNLRFPATYIYKIISRGYSDKELETGGNPEHMLTLLCLLLLLFPLMSVSFRLFNFTHVFMSEIFMTLVVKIIQYLVF